MVAMIIERFRKVTKPQAVIRPTTMEKFLLLHTFIVTKPQAVIRPTTRLTNPLPRLLLLLIVTKPQAVIRPTTNQVLVGYKKSGQRYKTASGNQAYNLLINAISSNAAGGYKTASGNQAYNNGYLIH